MVIWRKKCFCRKMVIWRKKCFCRKMVIGRKKFGINKILNTQKGRNLFESHFL